MKRQNPQLKKTAPPLVALAVFCLLLVSGCGVKPDKLSSPAPNDKTQFPATYPRTGR